MDLALTNAGETTNGNSPYEADLLNKLNRAHFTLCAGGTIALGKDQTIEIDETWTWSRARRPLVLELQPKYNTGSVTLTLGSEVGTFSAAPSYSVAGWYLRISGREGIFRIASHTAAATAFELDGAYSLASASGLTFEVFKLDYDLVPSFIVIDTTNNKIDFKKTSGGSVLTATLTSGSYSPADLATHVGSVMTTAASGPAITCTYSAVTRLFTITSDGAGSTTLLPMFATGTNVKQSAHRVLGYDDSDLTAALTHTSTYVLGGIARLVEPFALPTQYGAYISSIDPENFTRDYTIALASEACPSRFAVIGEKDDGTITVRFNNYPKDKTRIEIDYVPIPRDLKDNAGSVPLVPRKHADVLEDAATFFIMLLKSDDRANAYASLVAGKLKAMIAQHRGSLLRSGENFGQAIPRRDNMHSRRRRIFPSEPY